VIGNYYNIITCEMILMRINYHFSLNLFIKDLLIFYFFILISLEILWHPLWHILFVIIIFYILSFLLILSIYISYIFSLKFSFIQI
jgi:hypothetical protein